MSAVASSSSSGGAPLEARKNPGTVSRGRLGAFQSARKGLTQQFASQDRPKPAAQATQQPPSRFQRELRAIKDTFFNHNTTSLLVINFLIAFVPLGLAAGILGWGPLSTFGFNFLAIIPLAAILGASTEALSAHTGQVLGGLLNASLGNAVEMSVTVCAVQNGLVKVVQMSLIGSVLSNLLLVLGMSFIAAGLKTRESQFNSAGASSSITCLVLASLALTLPTVFTSIPGSTEEDALMLSRIIACVMAFVYVSFLFFQLGTHATLFRASQKEEDEKNPDAEMYHLSLPTALFFLVASTISVVYCSDYLVKSIQGVSERYGMPYAFIGLILLPIVGNAAEHTTAVTAAYHDMMDLAMGVAVGSSTQIALFVIPFSVLIGWWFSIPLSLDFQIFSTTVFLLSVFIASGVLSDGSGNWFEGLMLCATYVIVAIITWFIPDSGEHVHSRALSGLGAESALSSALPFLSLQDGHTLVI